MELILYHLVLMVGGWLVKMLKIVEKLSRLYGSATIEYLVRDRLRVNIGNFLPLIYGRTIDFLLSSVKGFKKCKMVRQDDWMLIIICHQSVGCTVVAGKNFVSGVSRLPLKTRYNNFVEVPW